MSTSINGKLLNATDLDPVSTSLDTVKSDILNAIANAGVPGEIKLVINPTGTAPAGTTKLENLAPEPTYSWLTAGEFRIGYLPKAFVVADAPNVKYVQAVNANEDFITSPGSTLTVKRFLASAGYVPATITLAGSSGVSLGNYTMHSLLDSGYLVYGASAVSISGFYSVPPTGTTSMLKLRASFTGYQSNVGYSNLANTGNTVVIFNGASDPNPSVINQLVVPGAWEFNPATNVVTTLPAPPFRSLLRYVHTANIGTEVFVLTTGRYSTDGTTLINSAPVDAIPLYKLSADRVWSKLGDMPSPYVKSFDGTLVASSTAPTGSKLFAAGGYLWIMPTVYGWPTYATIGLVRIDPVTGASSIVEIVNQAWINSTTTSQGGISSSVVGSHATTTADGSKVYNGLSSPAGLVMQLANVVNAQPQTAFYVKKN